ncbi:MarR family winged helix-turn-helix transcriptional regulator [Aestuariivirga sp.]|uniref:MarR family winged helix-turn-helix transcriptional regulator n=1 Tax=Aestuariivirga sp. TaxID=2650926 RepID=UPI00391A1EAF
MDQLPDHPDIVHALGHLTLGSRLKRIGERLQADVQRLAQAQGIEVPAALFPTLAALDRHEALTVSGLARALGIAQPGATRNLAQLEAMGLVASARKAKDQRVRSVTLSREGAELVAKMKKGLWPRVEEAVSALCGGLRGSLLEQLDGLERALDDAPLDRRAGRRR